MVSGGKGMVLERTWSFEHTHLRMSWIEYRTREKDGTMTYPFNPSSPSLYSGPFHREPNPSSSSSSVRVSPALLFIIVVLAALFFISCILHLLVRFLSKRQSSSSSSSQSNTHPEISESDALQRQLQQLFHLHDSGLDQTFIDALPVFHFKEIVGLKGQFDCAVCLCEFCEKDKLRLLPACSHAFHISCIDTWLLTNSTCPLCRGALVSPGFPMDNPSSDFGDPIEGDGFYGNIENGLSSKKKKNVEIQEDCGEKGVFPVRLGKFTKMNPQDEEAGGGETSSSNLDARRCFSMGSYQYIVRDANLRVALSQDQDVKGIYNNRFSSVDGNVEGINGGFVSKGDSFSVSKIWLWPKKDRFGSSSDNLNMELPRMGRTQGGHLDQLGRSRKQQQRLQQELNMQ